jgi:membrane fusion protein (multidrug efflux system)
LKRAEELFATRTISQAELDAARASLEQEQAQVENLQAIVAKKTIRAPFAGRLGIRQVNLGQFLNKGEGVVSLQALDPVFVEFAVPQQNLPLIREGLEVRVTIDAFPERSFLGKLTAINPDIDRSSRSLRMQATLSNPEALLRPGMYANVEVVLPEKRSVLVIPSTAVLYATFGDSVFVVEDGEVLPDGSRPMVVRQQLIRTGETQGDFVVVTTGLKEGQRVVTAGAFKLRNGASVIESTVGVVEPSLNPKLPNT